MNAQTHKWYSNERMNKQTKENGGACGRTEIRVIGRKKDEADEGTRAEDISEQMDR